MGGYATGNYLLPPTVRTPTRTLNSTGFQPNTIRTCGLIYSVRVQCNLSLTGGQQGLVQLLSDSSSTPTTVRSQGRNGNTGTLTIGLNTTQDGGAELSYTCPSSDYVIIKTTNLTGTPTFTLEEQTEEDY